MLRCSKVYINLNDQNNSITQTDSLLTAHGIFRKTSINRGIFWEKLECKLCGDVEEPVHIMFKAEAQGRRFEVTASLLTYKNRILNLLESIKETTE